MHTQEANAAPSQNRHRRPPQGKGKWPHKKPVANTHTNQTDEPDNKHANPQRNRRLYTKTHRGAEPKTQTTPTPHATHRVYGVEETEQRTNRKGQTHNTTKHPTPRTTRIGKRVAADPTQREQRTTRQGINNRHPRANHTDPEPAHHGHPSLATRTKPTTKNATPPTRNEESWIAGHRRLAAGN